MNPLAERACLSQVSCLADLDDCSAHLNSYLPVVARATPGCHFRKSRLNLIGKLV